MTISSASGTPQADHDTGERSGDDPRLARPREEDDLLPCPAAAPVGQQAEQDGHRPGEQDETRDDRERGHEVVPDVAPRQVRAERDEDEDHHHLGDRARRATRMSRSCVRVHPEPEAVHVADDQPGEEGAEVAAAAGRVDREVADRDDGDDRDRGRLTPDARPAVETTSERTIPNADPERGRDPEVLRRSRQPAR